jgi:putative ABC transport system permease protein
MIGNFFKMALRNLGRNRLVAFINVLGLALGLAICLLISLWTYHELAFDAFHKKGDRVVLFQQYEKNAGSGGGFASLIQAQISQVEKTARLAPTKALLSTQEEVYHEDYFYFADSSIFDVLSLPLTVGAPQHALAALVALLTISYQAIKAATINPAKNLRTK